MVYSRRRRVFRKRPSRLKKRWTLSAQIGKNVPIVGGTGLRLSSRSLKNVVTQVIKKTGESKIYINKPTAQANVSTGLLHNTIYTFNPLQGIALGTGERNRVGDSIFVKFIKLRYATQCTAAAPCQKYRVMVIKSDEKFNVPPTAFGSGFGLSDLFWPDGGGNYSLETIRCLKNLKDASITSVLYDRIHDVNFHSYDNGPNTIQGKAWDVTIPVNKKVSYDNVNSNYLKGDNYYVITIPWIGGGSTGSTQATYTEVQCMVTYIDS